MKNLLIIFAKAPEPGHVKTRLFPVLSPEEAASLQAAFIIDTITYTENLPLQRAMACSPSPNHPFFKQCLTKPPLLFIQQEGKDLGERMDHALRWGFSLGFEKVLLLGSDTPSLPERFIQEGLDVLDNKPWVIGPSLDGGYYLIGGKASFSCLFNGIRWGSDEVLTKTLEIFDKERMPCHLLPFWYDIDRPKDLNLLKIHIKRLKTQREVYPKRTSIELEGFKKC